MTRARRQQCSSCTSTRARAGYIDFVIHKKDSTSFFRMFNDVDLLLIDDIHFFSGKPSTQNQFFLIFNNLLQKTNKSYFLPTVRPRRFPI